MACLNHFPQTMPMIIKHISTLMHNALCSMKRCIEMK